MARMTADDFRAELAALANGLRRTIEADCAGFPADAKASARRVRRVQGDFPFCYTYSNLFITRQIDSMLTSCFIEAGFTFSEKKARAFLSTGLHRGTHGIVS